MKTYEAKRASTKNQLISAFWELMEKHEVKNISIRMITEQAGVSRGTFYLHFTDIFDLLNQEEERLLSSFPYQSFNSYRGQLSESLQYMRQFRKYYVLLLSEKGDPAFRRKIMSRLYHVVYPDQLYKNLPEEEQLKVNYKMGGLMNATIYYLENPALSDEAMIKVCYELLIADSV